MNFQLHVVRGRSASSAIKLADGVTVVGRHDDCQLRIKSSQVSRRHCELFEKKGMLLVKDLGSSNGTFVNGERIDGQRVLEEGDEITVGQVKLRVAKAVAPPVKSGPKAGDTAVPVSAEAAKPALAPSKTPPPASAPDSDEFEIDFDDLDHESESFEINEPIGEETQPVGILEEKKEAAGPEPAKTAPEPEKPAEAAVADDAIADFLLGIKIDEDE